MERIKRGGRASPLLIAVGPKDKENFASPDVLIKGKKSPGNLKKSFAKVNGKQNNKNIEMIKNQINNFQNEQKTKKQITTEDLTTNGSPGEAYWEQLSESRRVALEATWKENMELHSKIMELEYENTKLKAMLAEATTSIQLLTEMLDDKESDEEENDDLLTETQDEETTQDDSLEDASFTSV